MRQTRERDHIVTTQHDEKPISLHWFWPSQFAIGSCGECGRARESSVHRVTSQPDDEAGVVVTGDGRRRDALADSMCRHSLIADWYEKADLVLAELEAFDAGRTPLFEGTAADLEEWLGNQNTVDLVTTRVILYDAAGVVATGDNDGR